MSEERVVAVRELQTLIDRYKVALFDKKNNLELAELESQMWTLKRKGDGPGGTKVEKGERRDWFQTIFGGGTAQYDFRGLIYNAGEWAWSVFELADSGKCGLHTASRVITLARQYSRRNQITPQDALTFLLTEFNGSVTSLEKIAQAPPPIIATTQNKEETGSLQNVFKHRVLNAGREYLRKSLGPAVSDIVRSRLEEDFSASLQVLIDDVRSSVSKVQRQTRQEVIHKVNRADLAWACEVLGLGTIRYGQDIDLKKCRRLRMHRLRDLHPDNNPSDTEGQKTAKAAEYQNVNNAFEVVEAYLNARKVTNGK